MMKDLLDSILVILFVCFGGFIVGLLLGFASGEGSITKDCKALGQFRHNETVYECRLKS